jgi:hypothetical protein
MKKKGFAGGPFQLLIGMIVFGMALVIGAYLFDMINCWKCEELLKIEATQLQEAIASVGKGDAHSRKNDVVELHGYCAQGIYINHIGTDDGTINCRSFCPNHPNKCWVIVAESRCSGGKILQECIDISGDMEIDSDLGIGDFQSPDDLWKHESFAFLVSDTPVKIEKKGASELEISKP